MKKISLLSTVAILFIAASFAQNVDIGITTPSSKLQIKGSAEASQLN
jgi:hypothetical protein